MKTSSLRLSTSEKVSMVANLSTMLAAGIPILESVNSLLEESKGNQKKLLETLRDDLIAGNHVYTTFSKFPHVFNKVTVNLIKASEGAGTLETTLKDIKEGIQQEMEFNDKVRAAMMYPMFVLMVFVGVFFTILVVVVPKISTVFERLRVELPLPTKIMIFASNTLMKYNIYLLIGLVLVSLLLFFIYRQQKQLLLNIIFKLPIISKLMKDIDVTRFARSLYLLLNSGLPIAAALELAQDVVMKKEVADLVYKSREMVISGKDFSEGLRSKKGVMPAMMIKLIEVGEKSGTLADSMQDISVQMDYQVSKSLKSVTALLEPIMLVVVGLGVGGMMMAIIAPIYGLISQVGVR